jgi:hypothetical protein
MAPAPCVQWGTITLVLDNEAFRGYLSGPLAPMKRSITGKSKLSKNIFVAAYRHRMAWDGMGSRPSF